MSGKVSGRKEVPPPAAAGPRAARPHGLNQSHGGFFYLICPRRSALVLQLRLARGEF